MTISGLVVGTYLAVLLVLAMYGFHRSSLVWLYYRNRHRRPRPLGQFAELPAVTVQLPLFNEMYVVERLLDAVAGIRYPRDRFQIQVLDDSTDETQEICKRKVADLARRFPDLEVEYIHRVDRGGFKAGALQNGLRTAKGEFVLIFDADFLPLPDILERAIHHFSDPRVAVVQCRWEHVNRDFSALTEVEALMLDGHFIMEHAGRNWSGRFFNFNGTAGIWRRAAIADAGDWQHDTLTEDMDLSYRAQLRGWKFVYLPEIAAPAELPVEMSAFKSQQFRWAKGSVQVALKLLPTILRSNATFAQKSEAFFHLTNNLAYPLLLVLSILLLPNLALRAHHGWREVLMIDLPLFFGTTASVASFYLASAARDRADARAGRAEALHLVGGAAPAAGDVDRHRPLRQPDARGVRGAHGTRDRVRADAEARHPRQARELVGEEVPFRQVAHAVHRAADGRLLRGRHRRGHRSPALHLDPVPLPLPLRLRLRRLGLGLAGRLRRRAARRLRPSRRHRGGAAGLSGRGRTARPTSRGELVVGRGTRPCVSGGAGARTPKALF